MREVGRDTSKATNEQLAALLDCATTLVKIQTAELAEAAKLGITQKEVLVQAMNGVAMVGSLVTNELLRVTTTTSPEAVSF